MFKKINMMLAIVLAALLAPGLSLAVEPGKGAPPSSLTLTEVMALAAEQNLNVRTAQQEREVARGRITEAYAAAMPVVSAGADWRYTSDAISRGDSNDQGALSLSLAQPLFRGGSIRAGIRAAELYDQYSAQDLEAARLDTVQAACQRYYEVLLALAELKVAQETVDLSHYNLDVVNGRMAQGTATKLDVSRAREQLSNSKANQLQARNTLAIARMRLFTLLRLPPSSSTDVQGELACSLDIPPSQEAVETAMARRPDLQVLKSQAAMQTENIIAAKAERGVQVDLVGAYSQVTPENPVDESWEDQYYGGVSLSVPIFEGRRVQGKVAQEKARLRQYEFAVEQKADDILLEVNEALDNIAAAALVVKAREDSLAQAREALDLAQSGYQYGVNDQLDVLNAQLTFTNSRLQHLRAVYSQSVYYIGLQRATGTLLDTLAPPSPESGKGKECNQEPRNLDNG